MRRAAFLIVLLLPCTVAGCLDQSNEPEDPEHTVSVLDNRFEPTNATLLFNASLVFIHRGEGNHTVTVRLAGGESDGYLFDVADPGLMTGNRVSLQFPEPGDYIVYCRYHSDGADGMLMRATVT